MYRASDDSTASAGRRRHAQRVLLIVGLVTLLVALAVTLAVTFAQRPRNVTLYDDVIAWTMTLRDRRGAAELIAGCEFDLSSRLFTVRVDDGVWDSMQSRDRKRFLTDVRRDLSGVLRRHGIANDEFVFTVEGVSGKPIYRDQMKRASCPAR